MLLNFRKISALAFIVFVLSITSAFAWGPQGHKIITKHAIELLPVQMKRFYDANSSYIETFCMLPDDWRETHPETGSDHYIDLDLLANPPFEGIAIDRETAEKRFGKDKLEKAGFVPWVITDHYKKLVAAFKNNDPQEIVLQSSLLSHYIGDCHVPMHTTKNYDGDKPEEKGVHFRWESALPAIMLKPEEINAITPSKVNDILKSAFAWCISSYSYNDVIFRTDDKARKRDPGFGYSYYNIMWNETGDILKGQLTSASEDLAGTYIAAWEEAGKPALSDKCAAILWEK